MDRKDSRERIYDFKDVQNYNIKNSENRASLYLNLFYRHKHIMIKKVLICIR